MTSTASGDNEGRSGRFQSISRGGSSGDGGRDITKPREKGAGEKRVCESDGIHGGCFRPLSDGRADHGQTSGGRADQEPVSDGKAAHEPMSDDRADHGPMSDGMAAHEPMSDGKADHGSTSGGKANHRPMSVESRGSGRGSATFGEASVKDGPGRGGRWEDGSTADYASVAAPMSGGWEIDDMSSGGVDVGDGPRRGDEMAESLTAGCASRHRTVSGKDRPISSSRNSFSNGRSSCSSSSSNNSSSSFSRAVEGGAASTVRPRRGDDDDDDRVHGRPTREGHRSPLNACDHNDNDGHSNSDSPSDSNYPTTSQGVGGRPTASDDGRPRVERFASADGGSHDTPTPAGKQKRDGANDWRMAVEEGRAGWTTPNDGEGGGIAAPGVGGGQEERGSQRKQQQQQQQQQLQPTVRVVVNEVGGVAKRMRWQTLGRSSAMACW